MTIIYPSSICRNYLVTYYILYNFKHAYFGDCLDVSHNSDKNKQMCGFFHSNVTNYPKTTATHYFPDNRKSVVLQH